MNFGSRKISAVLAVVSASLFCSTAAFAAPDVVASIKPIHSLVAAVMAGVGEPTLLVKGAASPHTYSLRPSDAAALENADIVFWTGHGMELFLGDALQTLSPDATIVELAKAPGIALLPVREGGAFEAHSHGDEEGHEHAEGEAGHEGHDHDGHDHGEGDMHFWLDPDNGKVLVDEIAAVLAKADPDNAAAYAANAVAENAKLDVLTAELSAKLAPVADKPFIVFHDAYQYFESRFGLTVAGSVTVTPDVLPGAARIAELQAKVKSAGVSCIFAEPQFAPAITGAIIEGTSAKAGVLDPEGSALTEGVDLYPALITGLADQLIDCLASN